MVSEALDGDVYEDKHYTLVFCRREIDAERKVLLGYKKRGFGAGKWNGFGGKVEEGESFEEAAIRELEEESSIRCTSLTLIGYLVFRMEGSRKIMKVHIYETWDFQGDGVESDEMRPQWYAEDAIPFSDMWADDIQWFPYMLTNRRFVGRFDFEDDDETISDFSLNEQH